MRFAIRLFSLMGLAGYLLGPGASTAWSRQIQLKFTARVETVTGSPFGLGNIRGKTMTGSFFYDTETADSDLSQQRGLYKMALPMAGFQAAIENSNFSGSRNPNIQVENISSTDTFRYLDGEDAQYPNRVITMNGLAIPTGKLTFAITSSKNPLNADWLPDPFPFTPADPHTFSMADKNGSMLLQLQSISDAAPAPPGLVSVKIKMTDKRGRFLVDGGAYTDSKTFQWPRGSSHTLEFPISDDGRQYSQAQTSRWSFGGWSETSGLLDTSNRVMQVIANPDLEITGQVGGFQHIFQVNFFGDVIDMTGLTPPPVSAACNENGQAILPELRSGVVYMNQICYWQSFRTWAGEGTHQLIVYPYPGFAFLGWLGGGTDIPTQAQAFAVGAPRVIEARFTPARRVRFLTEPQGMQVQVDDVEVIPEPDVCRPLPVVTPATVKPPCVGEFDFAPNSEHLIAVRSPQRDRYGNPWVFDGFSNGMSNNSAYRVGPLTSATAFDTLTAKFVPGINSVISSKPIGVPIEVNGKATTQQYQVFKPGELVQVSAPLKAVVGGRNYTFKGWSNGGDREQTATIPKDAGSSFNLFAEYSVESQILIDSATPNASVLVDGTRCALPCSINGAPGREVRIEPPADASVSPSQRMTFVRWSDGGPAARIETLTGEESRRLEMHFANSFLLQLSTDPGSGADFDVQPASADYFYPQGTKVTVTAKTKGGFQFNRWTGDASGTQPTAEVTLDVPRTALALLDRVPYLAANPVRNAATKVAGPVAPGSVVSIIGESLAFEFVQGPDNPLSQAIYGTSVAVDYYRFVSLRFVSPQEIQAVLPSDLTPGEHTISVRRSGYDDVIGKFTVSTTAPGIFTTGEPGSLMVHGFRADGSEISQSNAAQPGEQVTVLATGLGVYQMTPVDGQPLPAVPAYEVLAKVDVLVGANRIEGAKAVGQVGGTGVATIQFTVPATTKEGAADLQLRVADADSPAALLPIAIPAADKQSSAAPAAAKQ